MHRPVGLCKLAREKKNDISRVCVQDVINVNNIKFVVIDCCYIMHFVFKAIHINSTKL